MCQIRADSLLSKLPIPFRAMVLEELSSLPLWQNKEASIPSSLVTVEDLAQESALNCDQLILRLCRIIEWSPELRIDQLPHDLKASDNYQLLTLSPMTNDYQRSVYVHDLDFTQAFSKWQSSGTAVIVVSENEARSFSACLYLKELGLGRVHYWALKRSAPDWESG